MNGVRTRPKSVTETSMSAEESVDERGDRAGARLHAARKNESGRIGARRDLSESTGTILHGKGNELPSAGDSIEENDNIANVTRSKSLKRGSARQGNKYRVRRIRVKSVRRYGRDCSVPEWSVP
ncbi:hypothetical protein OS493_007642 [Desmophyllum pertusum]|uniref:Uncharacterized protein n=1 Tax=Desmophyllum pertusum TaxID=174260 RepID=A0A9W9YRR4_9CNID|nr:hypothetical protein OS493_007642 [Desmophyllum pertusum]